MINIKELIETEGLGKYIYGGDLGEVYRIGETPYAIKIARRDDEWSRWALNHEWEMGKALYHCKISVPKPFGTIKIINPDTKKIVPAFCMKYIDGQNLFQIEPGELKERIMVLRDEEVSSAKKMGFVCEDAYYPGNMIWCPPKEKVYLVDFVEWNRK